MPIKNDQMLVMNIAVEQLGMVPIALIIIYADTYKEMIEKL
jgi:hypothetical protein